MRPHADGCECDRCVPPTCSECRWYRASECQRRAPAPNTQASDYRRRIFPVMSPIESCGDFEAR